MDLRKKQMTEVRSIVEKLGGPQKVAMELGIENVKPAAKVCNWYTRGIPDRKRPRVMKLAEEAGITLTERERAALGPKSLQPWGPQ
jgi:hypothetical protein